MGRVCGVCGQPLEDHELQEVTAADARALAAVSPALHPAMARSVLIGGQIPRVTRGKLEGRTALDTAPARVCPVVAVEVDGRTVWRRRSAPDAAA